MPTRGVRSLLPLAEELAQSLLGVLWSAAIQKLVEPVPLRPDRVERAGLREVISKGPSRAPRIDVERSILEKWKAKVFGGPLQVSETFECISADLDAVLPDGRVETAQERGDLRRGRRHAHTICT